MKTWLTIAVALLAAGAVQAATIYDYTGNMNSSAWTLEKYDSDGYWNVVFQNGSYATASQQQLQNQYGGYAPTPAPRGAFTWTAPVGQYISNISFTLAGSNNPADMKAIVYTFSSTGQSLQNANPYYWTGATSGNFTVNFSSTDQVQKIGLGFLNNVSYNTWYVGYSAAKITTEVIPEPASLGLLALGALVLGRRRR